MKVRRATSSDIDEIRQVAASTWKTDYPDILNREVIKDGVNEWYDPDQLDRELAKEDAIILVAETDEVVGFAHSV